jgi:hypothetical protein
MHLDSVLLGMRFCLSFATDLEFYRVWYTTTKTFLGSIENPSLMPVIITDTI